MRKSPNIVPACCALMLIAVSGGQTLRGQDNPKQETIQLDAPDNAGDGLVIETRSTPKIQNTTTTLKGAGLPVSAPASAPARDRAYAFVQAHAGDFGLLGGVKGAASRAAAEIAVKQELPQDEVGLEHVRFQQLHQGIPVTGGEILVHLRGNRVVSVQSEVVLDVEAAGAPAISAQEALKQAQQLMRRLDPSSRQPVYTNPRLEILNRGVLREGTYPTQQTWFVEAHTEKVREFIWINAATGGIVLNFNQRPTALNRKVYTAGHTDTLPGTLVRSEGGPATGDADADLAYLYAGDTYNYYLTQHGRNSYDGAGAALLSTVHYCPPGECPYQNAFWDGTQMVYGDSYSTADDVTAHELTHAVTEHTAGLFYYMQSGALNESFSDIFGETVDLLNGRGNDAASVRWKMGEDLPIGAIRDMMNPWSYGNPGKVSDAEWTTDQNSDQGGVHTNSGVPNHAYALMVDGGVYNGRNITGIGLTAAGKIQYRALTKYLTSGANFLDNYKALLQACQDLIGTSGITAATCTQVKSSTEAVELNGPIPFNAPVPNFCPAGQSPSDLFADDFETIVPGNWTKRILRGTGSWVVPDTGWAKSGTHTAYGQDFDAYNDATLEMAKSFTLPVGSRLQFNHGYAFEVDLFSAYDGGVIEYSLDGGATWKDAGSLIVAGDKYDASAPIDNSSGNSLAGRLAFVGSSFGYTATQLDLASLAGKSVRFRFRVGTDELVGNTGWVVDDVRLYTCSASYTISGKITKAGVGLANATVQLTGGTTATTTTNATGAYSFATLAKGGTYTITPSMANTGFTPPSLTYTNLQANQTAANFTAVPTFTVSGKMTKAGVALVGVTVKLTGGKTATATTGPAGGFAFTGLPAGGTYTITPSLANTAFTPPSLTFTNLQASQTAANFTAVPAFTVSGKVIKAGVALAGVTIKLTGGKTATATTDAAGAFSFATLPSGGTYTITPSLANTVFAPPSLTYANLQANQTTANFTAFTAFTVSGAVTKGGVALAGVTVKLTGGKTGTTTTNSAGAFSFAGLKAGGTYTITPSLANNTFTPPSITYSNLQANQPAANFNAVAALSQVDPPGQAASGSSDEN